MLRGFLRPGRAAVHPTRKLAPFGLMQGKQQVTIAFACSLSRNFSAIDPTDISTFKHMDRATFFVANPKRNPLGTMDTSSFDEVQSIMSGWLKRKEWDSELEPNATTKLFGYSVDAAERLLQRLIDEKAATKAGSIARHQRDLAIAEWQPAVLNAWIHVATLQQYDRSILAAASERAEMALGRIVEWYNQGLWLPRVATNEQDPLPVLSFARLCRLWLRLDSADGFVRAADLLITWTDREQDSLLLDAYKSDISQCFNAAMIQCSSLLRRQDESDTYDELRKAAAALVGRMDLLRESGWDELDEVTALARKVALMETLQRPGEIITSEDKSRQFEEAAMFQQMTDLIGAAGSADQETIVDEVIPRLIESKNMPTHLARNFSTALVDFFIRVQDAKQANHWMQRLGMIDAALSHQDEDTLRFNRLLAIFELWTEKTESEDTEEAIWRAEELLRRCETIESQEVNKAESELCGRGVYLKMLRLWSTYTNDTDLKARKVLEFFDKAIGTSGHDVLDNFQLSDIKLVLAAVSDVSGNKLRMKEKEINFLIDVLEKKSSGCSSGEMDDILIQLMHVGEGKLALKMCHRLKNLASSSGAIDEAKSPIFSASLCQGILESCLPEMTTTEKRIGLIQELGGFDGSGHTKWNLDCYNMAIGILLQNKNGDKKSFDAAKKLLQTAFAWLAKKNVQGVIEENLSSFVANALDQCTTTTKNDKPAKIETARVALAREILVMAEDKFLSKEPGSLLGKSIRVSPISTTCFEKVLHGLYLTNQVGEFDKTFLRLYDYFRIAGYENLLPGRSIVATYMEHLKKRKAGGKELEDILNEWSGHCKGNGQESGHYANKAIYSQVFRAFAEQKDASGAVNFAIGQLQAMKSGQADKEMASLVMEEALRTVCHSKADDQCKRMLKQLFQRFGMDQSLKIKLQPNAWRDLLFASAGASQEALASKASIMALTELRKVGQTDHWGYNRVVAVHIRQAGPEVGNVLRVVFQSCCEDGFLSPSLVRVFQSQLEANAWKELYTSKMLNGKAPTEWSAKLSNEERLEEKVSFAEIVLHTKGSLAD